MSGYVIIGTAFYVSCNTMIAFLYLIGVGSSVNSVVCRIEVVERTTVYVDGTPFFNGLTFVNIKGVIPSVFKIGTRYESTTVNVDYAIGFCID